MADILTDGNEPALSVSLTPPPPSVGAAPLIQQSYPFSVRVRVAPPNPALIQVIVQPFDPNGNNTFTLGNTSPVVGVVNVAVPITLGADKRSIQFALTFDSNAAGQSYFYYGYNTQTQKQVGGGIGIINFT